MPGKGPRLGPRSICTDFQPGIPILKLFRAAFRTPCGCIGVGAVRRLATPIVRVKRDEVWGMGSLAPLLLPLPPLFPDDWFGLTSHGYYVVRSTSGGVPGIWRYFGACLKQLVSMSQRAVSLYGETTR
jgi:hypothetical protein